MDHDALKLSIARKGAVAAHLERHLEIYEFERPATSPFAV
jgi:hypothetical protein